MSTPSTGRTFTRPALPDAVVSLLTLAFLAMLIRTAWLSDDALITLRSVLNVTHGFGLRYNIDERVQTFTHPLWLFVITGFYYVTSNVYFAAFAAAVLTSLAAFWLAVTRAASIWQAAAVVVILFSRARSSTSRPRDWRTRCRACCWPASSSPTPAPRGQTGVRHGSDQGQTP